MAIEETKRPERLLSPAFDGSQLACFLVHPAPHAAGHAKTFFPGRSVIITSIVSMRLATDGSKKIGDAVVETA